MAAFAKEDGFQDKFVRVKEFLETVKKIILKQKPEKEIQKSQKVGSEGAKKKKKINPDRGFYLF